MRLLLFCCIAVALVYQVSARPGWWDSFKSKVKEASDFVSGAAKGTRDMHKAYNDMKEANWKESDKYFHARGNHDAAQHGAGGKWAAEVISDAREGAQSFFGSGDEDAAADQAANRWGREGGDPNKYRPAGLPEKYKR